MCWSEMFSRLCSPFLLRFDVRLYVQYPFLLPPYVSLCYYTCGLSGSVLISNLWSVKCPLLSIYALPKQRHSPGVDMVPAITSRIQDSNAGHHE